jgi:hypothetical protein
VKKHKILRQIKNNRKYSKHLSAVNATINDEKLLNTAGGSVSKIHPSRGGDIEAKANGEGTNNLHHNGIS